MPAATPRHDFYQPFMPSPDTWPDAFDWFAIAIVSAIGVGMPIAGYVFMALDYRAYLRSLRGALVVVRGYATSLPAWVRRDSPPCFAALGLHPPCTRQQVLDAYRSKVKSVHPDLGGSRRHFAKLQRHFEHALSLASDAEPHD